MRCTLRAICGDRGHRRARVIVAHVRKKTVGELAIANTHPFRRGRIVFAHNGTLTIDRRADRARSSPERLAEIVGDTDSERLFAFVLTHIDEAGDIERGVVRAIRALQRRATSARRTFCSPAGTRVYAYRQGRSLFTLSRDERDAGRERAAHRRGMARSSRARACDPRRSRSCVSRLK